MTDPMKTLFALPDLQATAFPPTSRYHGVETAVREAAVACARYDIVLTARAENYLYDKLDLDDTITRLLAFKDAGAETLYAPGVQDADDIELIVTETGAPINVLALPGTPSLEALDALGVRRASTGSIISNAARAATMASAAEFLTR